MNTDLTPQRVAALIEDQEQLAVIATCDGVRAMHHDLATLYRSQLACILAAAALAVEPVLQLAA